MAIVSPARRLLAGVLVVAALSALAAGPTAQPLPGRARLIVVFVLDGLRPDAINADDTPTLFRLRREGVSFLDGHAVFPTVTRVNAAALATGTYPGTNGINGNRMYVPAVHTTQAFSNDDFRNLLKLDQVSGGRMVLATSLAEHLRARGRVLAAVSSGSTGSALLLNPRAARGVGILVNGYLEPGVRVAHPEKVNAEILARFGPAPAKGGRADPNDAAVDWAQHVLREYVIPELQPDVVLNWLTEPDHVQHALGASSPAARRSIANDDRHLGLILARLERLGLAGQVDVFVVSDHGFSLNTYGVNVVQELIGAGLKAGPESDDVVVASSGQSALLHVKNRDAGHIRRLVEFLHGRDWTGVVFTAARTRATPVDPAGRVEGTFSLELIHAAHPERGPDIVLTFPWTSAKNAFGVEGTDFAVTAGAAGPLTGTASDHGSMSPWTVRNTFLAWGVDFKEGVTLRTPASNVDVAPTILALQGITGVTGLEGRVLLEALKGGPDEEQVAVERRVYTTEASGGRYRAAIQVSEVPGQRYVDKSWRIR
jgi:predicted AlkP superfamily pyrophosphatase or phosphodiesterase